LLRESCREGCKVKWRTLADISHWPEAKIDSRRRALAGETLLPFAAERSDITSSLAHGHVGAALGAVRRLGLDKALPKGQERRAKLILAMIVAGHRAGPPSRRRRASSARRPLPTRSAPCSASARSTRTNSTPFKSLPPIEGDKTHDARLDADIARKRAEFDRKVPQGRG
jgi:hypothetical protein